MVRCKSVPLFLIKHNCLVHNTEVKFDSAMVCFEFGLDDPRVDWLPAN